MKYKVKNFFSKYSETIKAGVLIALLGSNIWLINKQIDSFDQLLGIGRNLELQIDESRKAREIDEEKASNRQRSIIRYTKCLADILIVSQRKEIKLIDLEKCQYRDIRRQENVTLPPSTGGTSSKDPAIRSGKEVQPDETDDNGNGEAPEPDNDGIILDLPGLPKIHIPSPL